MNANTTRLKAVVVALVASSLLASSGCGVSKWKPSKMFSMDSTWPFRDKDEPREGTPERMVCTWTDSVMTKAGQKPQRGFGGRIMFYEKDEKDPVKIDGQLVVYAFDETERDPTDNKPTRRYVFPAEQMSLHMSKSDLGASYSFWLPWDEAGGPKTEVGLICRFEPKDGAVVTSEQTTHRLPGTDAKLTLKPGEHKKPPKVPEGVPAKPALQTLQDLQAKRIEEQNTKLASYEAPVAGSPQTGSANSVHDVTTGPSRRMTSTTINLPNNFQMPNAAQLMSQAQAVNHQQLAAQSLPPAMANQAMLAQTPAMNGVLPGAVPQLSAQQLAINNSLPPGQAFMPASSAMGAANLATQPQVQLGATGTMMPGPPAIGQPLANFNAAANPTPMMQQAAQQMAVQQQLMQQQYAQQQMMQQHSAQQQALQQQMIQQMLSGQGATQATAQMPATANGAATVTYPAGPLYR
jgi:hypothetical protein